MPIRFDDHREITAKFDSTASCGHAIKTGDRIGYGRKHGQSSTQCPDCWGKWSAENREADAIESGYMPQCM